MKQIINDNNNNTENSQSVNLFKTAFSLVSIWSVSHLSFEVSVINLFSFFF